jgi:hypothetical protein
MTTAAATPPFVPDTLPRTVTASPDHPNVERAGLLTDDDESTISQPSSQFFTPPSLVQAPRAISGFYSNATREIGPLDVPDDILGPDRGVMSQPSTPPFPSCTSS